MTQPEPQKPSPDTKKLKSRRWRRRTIVALLILIAVIFVLRSIVGLLLPPILSKVAGQYQLQCTYDRLDLNLLSGTAELWGLDISPAEGGEPIFQTDYCQGEISLYNLIKGRLVVYRMVADGVDLNIERTADGRIPILARFAKPGNSPPPQTSAAPTNKPVDLTPPLRIDALRLSHVRARFHDQFISPELDSRMTLDVRLTDLGTPGLPTLFELNFDSDPVLDLLKIEGKCTSDPQSLTGTLSVTMRGLHPKLAEGYLRQIGLHAVADNVSAYVSGELKASVAANPADGIQATLLLHKARLLADGQESAAMDELQLNAAALNTQFATLSDLQIHGVRFQSRRNVTGALGACGLELATPTAPAAPTPQSPTIAPVAASKAAYRFKLAQFELGDLHTSFRDDSVEPPVSLALDLNKLTVQNFDTSPDQSEPSVKFAVTMTSPGMVHAISATGELHPLADRATFALAAQADGIAPTAIKPYLDAAGLESEWKNGKFTCTADGALTTGPDGSPSVAINLTNIALSDAQKYLTFDSIHAAGTRINPQTGMIRASAIDISGPDLLIKRDPSGQLHALGFATKTPSASPPIAPIGSANAHGAAVGLPTTPPRPTPALPKIALDHFSWKNIHLALQDDSINPPAKLEVSDAGVDLTNLLIDVDSTTRPSQPGRIHAWLASPQLAQKFSADGTILTGNHQANVLIDLAGQGIHGDAIAAYLEPLGIEPLLKNGSLHCHTTLTANDTDGMAISLACENIKYADGNQSLASLSALHLNNLRSTDSGLSIDALEIDSPHAIVTRNASGALEVGGVRLIAATAQQSAPAIERVSTPPLPPATKPPLTVSLKEFILHDASIRWIDHATPKPVDTTAHLNIDAANLNYGQAATLANLHFDSSVDGSVDSLSGDGALTTAMAHQAIHLDILGQGIRAGPAAAYLPPNIRCTLKDGRLRATVDAQSFDNPLGGRTAEFQIAHVDYRDQSDGPSLFGFDTFHAKASRLDPGAKVIAIDDISLKGLKTDATKTSTGLDMLGIEVTPAAAQSTQTPTAAPAPATQPNSPPAPSADVLTQIALQRNKYPWITVNSVDLNVSHIGFTDRTRPQSASLVVSNLRLHNVTKIGLLGKDPESNPPTQLELTGNIIPVVNHFTVTAHATPFARQKSFGLDLLATGINGAGITQLAPELASKIDGRALTSGQFHAALDGTLKLQTADPASFDLSRGGKLEFTAKDINFRADPAQPVLAGIGEIHSEGIALAPNLQGVEVKQLEIDNITGRASLAKDGVHALGLTIKTPPPSTQKTAPQQTAQTETPDPPPAVVTTASAPPEYKIDKLAITGMDFRFEDQTCDPPLIVPLDGLDLEAQNLSSLAQSQDKPIRFSLMVSSAKTPLPPTNAGEKAQDRELFSQVAASGLISLFPHTQGWAKASVSGFDLISLHALADQEKVKLGGGSFDGDLDVRFIEDGTIDTSTKLVLTDLSLSEPPDGPISRTLKLPAPLDVVIGALQDPDGSITVPLNVPMKGENIDKASVAASAAGTLGEIIATAVVSAPLKAANLFGPATRPNDQQPPVVIDFFPGYIGLDLDQRLELLALAKKLRHKSSLDATLKHEMGAEDIQLAASRVNPSPDDALALAGQFERQKQDLLASRQEAVGELRAILASGTDGQSADAVARLRTIDREFADTENAMDRAYELLRPGADRQALRRTRAACLLIARARLEFIRDILTTGGDKSLADRIHITNPQFKAADGLDHSTVTIAVLKKK